MAALVTIEAANARRRRRYGRWFALACCALAWLVVRGGHSPPLPVRADDAPPGGPVVAPERGVDGPEAAYVLSLPLPLVGSVDERVRLTLDRWLESQPAGGPRPVLVLEFSTPADRSGAGSQFERALALARLLTSDKLSRVRTIAFLPQSVVGHAVLPVLACEEIAIAPGAELGAAGRDEAVIDAAMISAYRDIASRRQTIAPAVAAAMLDGRGELLRADTIDGSRFLLREELADLQQRVAISEVTTLAPAGDMALFTGRDLRLRLGLAAHLAADRQELSRALGLQLRLAASAAPGAEGWRAVRIDLSGPITSRTSDRVQRIVGERLQREPFDLLILRIDSAGGQVAESMRLAQFLAELEQRDIRTVAYVPAMARGDAALVALACDQLVLGENAILGGGGARVLTAAQREALPAPVQQLAGAKGRDWALLAGLVDPTLEVLVARQDRAVRFFTVAEVEQARAAGDALPAEPINLGQGLVAQQATEWGVATIAVDDAELLRTFGLPDDLAPAEPNWSDVLVDALASEGLAYMFLFMAFFMLLAEFSSPGLGVPGFLSALGFSLFFWSRYLNGTAEWLEIILFLLGVCCLALEVFVIPGFGVFGLGGGALIIVSIILASQTFIVPRNVYQFEQLPRSLGAVAVGFAGLLTAAYVLRKVLPEAPMFRRLLLAPPENEALAELDRRERIVDWSHLAGRSGVAETPLVPSGKAKFGSEVVDVLARGGLVDKGTPVVVVEAIGNRVVVEPIEEAEL